MLTRRQALMTITGAGALAGLAALLPRAQTAGRAPTAEEALAARVRWDYGGEPDVDEIAADVLTIYRLASDRFGVIAAEWLTHELLDRLETDDDVSGEAIIRAAPDYVKITATAYRRERRAFT